MQHRKIGHRVGTDQRRGEAAAVGQVDGNVHRIFHHVAVGDDVALFGKNHTGAGGAAAVEGAGNGHHGSNVIGVNLLQGQTTLLRHIGHGVGGGIQFQRGSCNLGSFRGILHRSGFQQVDFAAFHNVEGSGIFIGLIVQLVEELHIQNAQHTDKAA